MEMHKIFSNKELKNAISLLLTVGIGLLGSSMGSWNPSTDSYFYIKLTGLIVLSIIFLIFLIFSYKYDKDDFHLLEEKEKIIQHLEQQLIISQNEISVYEKSNLSMAAIFQTSADDINTTANNIKKDNLISLDFWNFKKECKWICEKVLNIIEQISINDDNFAVSIFQLNPLAKGKSKGITMIAHSSKYGNTPDVYETPLTYRKNSDFYAIKLFKSEKHESTILIDENEINEKFIYKNDNHPKYSQYIAIPIYCNGNEMLSLLQIVAFENAKIGNTKSEITNKINKYIFPYAQLGLMMFKYEKGLLNCGYIVEKLKGEFSK